MRKEITVRQDGPLVVVIIDGRATELPPHAALDVARAIYTKAKQAEEVANAEGIIFDQALLLRTGAPFGLTADRDLQREAAKAAAHDPSLRKYLPGGIHERSQRRGQLGTPGVYHEGGNNGHA